MDKGFELMIPRATKEEEEKGDSEYKVKFTFFKKEFENCHWFTLDAE